MPTINPASRSSQRAPRPEMGNHETLVELLDRLEHGALDANPASLSAIDLLRQEIRRKLDETRHSAERAGAAPTEERSPELDDAESAVQQGPQGPGAIEGAGPGGRNTSASPVRKIFDYLDQLPRYQLLPEQWKSTVQLLKQELAKIFDDDALTEPASLNRGSRPSEDEVADGRDRQPENTMQPSGLAKPIQQ